MSETMKKTHLYEFHRRDAKIVEFAGFQMPMWYKGIIPEHMAVRTSAGLFDITHMGRSIIAGSESEAFLNYVTTNDVSSLTPMSAHYSTMLNQRGGIKDDFVLSRLKPEEFLIVYNAANRTEDYQWLVQNSKSFSVKIEDVSDNIAMFAIQGPKAQPTLQKIASTDLNKIERFKCAFTKLADVEAFVSRTGYTGEDGFEVFILDTPIANPTSAIKVWNAILKAGADEGMERCGLGARDTLRLEAGMCLYGNDIDENTTPLEARIGFVVKLKKDSFIGKDALAKQKVEGIKRRRVGLRMLEKGIPRPQQEVWKQGKRIGRTTSGTFSPILKRGIAMAYIPIQDAKQGGEVEVRIRDRLVKAEIVKFPFYDPNQYGHGRKN